ncbi:MAG TPA: FkbM family methyltransferase [Dehalococcoidia bacterium]|nr:FkbM family methyltransferase [Dehalococcoidia bacterium]
MSFTKQRTTKKPHILERAIRLYKNEGLASLIRNIVLRVICKYIDFLNSKSIRTTERYVVREINGSQMYLDMTDIGLSCDLMIDGLREAYILETIKKELSEGDFVIDIGANIGYYALLEAKIVGARGRVYAIEPVPESADLLRKNIELNGYSNIEVYQIAIGDKKESAPIHIARQRNISSMRQISSHAESGILSQDVNVDVLTLDDFLKDRPHPQMIRMDVEGYECRIINGMEKTLGENTPLTLFIELHFNILEPEETITLLKILRDADFEIADVTSETMIRGSTRHRFLWKIASYIERML